MNRYSLSLGKIGDIKLFVICTVTMGAASPKS